MSGAESVKEQERGRTKAVSKWSRDLTVSLVATGLFAYEVVFGGGRAAVLTACVSLLLSPVIMRVDEARREKNPEEASDE